MTVSIDSKPHTLSVCLYRPLFVSTHIKKVNVDPKQAKITYVFHTATTTKLISPANNGVEASRHPPHPARQLQNSTGTPFHSSQLNPFATYFGAETAIFKPFWDILGGQMGNHRVKTSQNHLFEHPKMYIIIFGKLPFSPLLDLVFIRN